MTEVKSEIWLAEEAWYDPSLPRPYSFGYQVVGFFREEDLGKAWVAGGRTIEFHETLSGESRQAPSRRILRLREI